MAFELECRLLAVVGFTSLAVACGSVGTSVSPDALDGMAGIDGSSNKGGDSSASIPETGAQSAEGGPETGAQSAEGGPETGVQSAEGGPETGVQSAEGGPETGAQSAEGGPDSGSAGASSADAGSDAMNLADGRLAPCDLNAPFGAPTLLMALNAADASTDGFSLSADGLTAYISSLRTGTQGYDIFTARRGSPTDPFAAPTLLAGFNTAVSERSPVISPDGLALFFYRSNPSGEDIYVSTRPTPLAAFSTPVAAGAVNAPDVDENTGAFTADGRTFYFSSRRSGAFRIYRSMINASGELQPPQDVGELNSVGTANSSPVVSADHLTIYFTRDADIMVARRTTVTDGFGAAVPVGELNSSGTDFADVLSADGCTLYFASNRRARDGGTGYDLYSAARPPVTQDH